MKLYEVWEGDLYLGIFYEDEYLMLCEGNSWIHGVCVSD